MDALLWLMALILALAPAAGLLWYIRKVDKFEPEPWSMMGLAFLAGCVSVIPAVIIEYFLHPAGQALGLTGFVGTIFDAFLVAGLTEEVSKGSVTYLFMWRRTDFNEVMDGIVYFGVGHMGFAVTENLKYVFLETPNIAQGLMTAFARTTTAVPLHVINGMIMGYYMGMARYARNSRQRWLLFLKAFAIPIVLHGFYDLAAFNEGVEIHDLMDLLRTGFGTAALYASVVALWLVLMPKIKAAQDASPWKPQEWPSLPVAPVACPNCRAAYPMGANYCHMCAAPVSADSPASYGQRTAEENE